MYVLKGSYARVTTNLSKHFYDDCSLDQLLRGMNSTNRVISNLYISNFCSV